MSCIEGKVVWKTSTVYMYTIGYIHVVRDWKFRKEAMKERAIAIVNYSDREKWSEEQLFWKPHLWSWIKFLSNEITLIQFLK